MRTNKKSTRVADRTFPEIKSLGGNRVILTFANMRDALVWIKFNTDYVAGIVGGAGLLLFLLALSADAGMISADGLKSAGTKFAGLAMILASGGMKWRAQSRSNQ